MGLRLVSSLTAGKFSPQNTTPQSKINRRWQREVENSIDRTILVTCRDGSHYQHGFLAGCDFSGTLVMLPV